MSAALPPGIDVGSVEVRMPAQKCPGSFGNARGAQPFTYAKCPHCGRELKVRFADGGYERKPSYTYFPRHLSSSDKSPK